MVKNRAAHPDKTRNKGKITSVFYRLKGRERYVNRILLHDLG